MPTAARPATARKPGFPTRIGRFRVLKVLGKGSQGIVYLAVDPNLDRQVAIKTLRPQHGDRGHLIQEARTVGRLQHAHIVPVFEVAEVQGHPYVVYEYVEGSSLRDKLKAEGALPAFQAINLMIPILDAMAYAHEQGVIHRDLNPGNIHVGEHDIPRVMDFGISTMIGPRASESQGIWGTVNYMAPEQFDNGGDLATSDIFSLGLILWEMLTGEGFASGRDTVATMYRISNEEVPAPSSIRADIDADLDAIVRKSTARDLNARYQRATDMKQALEDYLDRSHEASSNQQDKQATLSFLLRRMRRRSEFPAVSAHISEINRKASSPESTTAGEMANIILRDYALSTKLLKLVNSSFYGQYGGQISTISKAVVILGYKQVRMAALSLLMFEHLGNNTQKSALQDEASQSFLSAVMARDLAKDVGIKETEQAFICSMFYNLGRYLTVFYLPEEHLEIERAMSGRGLNEEEASRSILGLSFEDLGIGVAREWQLPVDILDSMRRDPASGSAAAHPSRPVFGHLARFSNELSGILADPGSTDKNAALTELMDRHKDVVPLNQAKMKGLVSSALEDMQVFATAANMPIRNGNFFRQANDWAGRTITESAPIETRSPDPARPSGASPAPRNDVTPGSAGQRDHRGILLDGIQDITEALLQEYVVNDILEMVLETIFRGLGMSRVILCILDRKNRRMSARHAFGQDVEHLLTRFNIPICRGDDPFSQTIVTGKDIHVDVQGQMTTLPDWYRKLLNPGSFALYPVRINKLTLGIIYADREDPDHPITDEDLHYLRTLRNQAALAIKQKS